MHTKPWKVIQTVYIVTFQTITCISVPHEVRLHIMPHCHIPCNSDDFFLFVLLVQKKKKKVKCCYLLLQEGICNYGMRQEIYSESKTRTSGCG